MPFFFFCYHTFSSFLFSLWNSLDKKTKKVTKEFTSHCCFLFERKSIFLLDTICIKMEPILMIPILHTICTHKI